MNEENIKANKTDNHPMNIKPPQSGCFANAQFHSHSRSLRSLRLEAEIYAIRRALEYTGWNRRKAAQLLCISYRGMLSKIRQHNLSPPLEIKSQSPAA